MFKLRKAKAHLQSKVVFFLFKYSLLINFFPITGKLDSKIVVLEQLGFLQSSVKNAYL